MFFFIVIIPFQDNFISCYVSSSNLSVCLEWKIHSSLSLVLFLKLTSIGEQLLYNIVMVFAIHQHELATGMHVSPPCWTPLPPHSPSPSSRLSEFWLWVPCIIHQLPTGFLLHIWQCICFNAIFSNHPPSPSPTVPKSLSFFFFLLVCFFIFLFCSSCF